MINDLTQGHYEASIGFLPFIPAGILRGGRFIVRGPGAEVLGGFAHTALNAIKTAKQATSRATQNAAIASHLTVEVVRVACEHEWSGVRFDPLGLSQQQMGWWAGVDLHAGWPPPA